MTGPIFANPWIHHTGSESSWPWASVYSRHAPFLPPKSVFWSIVPNTFSKIWDVEDLEGVMGQPCFCESIFAGNECLHSDATLEDSMLQFHSHLSYFAQSISRCLNDLNFDFAFRNSPGCMIHPNPASETRSRSLIPNSPLASISPPQVLLLVFFPASTSSTWFWNC